MARLLAEQGPLRARRSEPSFHVLAVSVINQQLSQKAADAIEARVAQAVSPPFTPDGMLRAGSRRLRAAGLSQSKVCCLTEVAARDRDGSIPFDRMDSMDDDAVIAALTAAPGIGLWTAEMFLMFALQRPDVVSLGDAALRRAARKLYGSRFRGDDEAVLAKASLKWRPYRTVACRLLWRSLDDR